MIVVNERLTIDERHIEERFVRASGPGGQNVNKVSTAVELRLNIPALGLPAHIEARLIALAGSRVSGDGILLIDSRSHRTQALNRKTARERLVDLLDRASRRPKSRRPTRPGAGARERRLVSKKLRSKVKEQRGGGRGNDD